MQLERHCDLTWHTTAWSNCRPASFLSFYCCVYVSV